MLDELDLKAIQEIVEQAQIVPGFYCLLGPEELFQPTAQELARCFEVVGITNLAIADLSTINVDDIEQLAAGGQAYTCLYGRAASPVLQRIELKRDAFLQRGLVIIFLLMPLAERELWDDAPAIGTHLLSKGYLGSQRILEAMGTDFQNRLRMVLKRISDYEEKLDELIGEAPADEPDSIVVLKRWNSFSPIVAWRRSSELQSVEEDVWRRLRRDVRGGGYLLRWQGFGVAVDPGHNFIENLYKAGFSIADLDAVVLSHDHLDHTADFEAILDLLYQRNKRGHTQSMAVFLNPTTYQKYRRMLEHHSNVARFADIPVNPGSRWISRSPGIRLSALRAQHKELGGVEQALSLRFDLFSPASKNKVRLGFTADTGWHAGLAPFFQETDVLIPHLGSIKSYELDEARRYPTHLGILGLFKLIEQIAQGAASPVVILSEFGEELMGLRDLVADELGSKFPGLRIFPGDIGHRVELAAGSWRIVCSQQGCEDPACMYFEQEGEIRLRCESHQPTFGKLGAL